MTLPDAPAPAATLTVGVATRNRPGELVRCLRSLRLLEGLLAEAIVVDDASDPPAAGPAQAALAADLPPEVRFLRNPRSLNVSACRNLIAREAATPWLLALDDDAFIVSRAAIDEAVRILEADPEIAVVGFAQADGQGAAFPPEAQGTAVTYPCYVPAFVGFAHLLRRDAFLAVGGFREQLGINGEEKELCLRLLDRGYRVVYLPHAPVGHLAATAGRDRRRYLRQTVRNTTLSAIYDEPFPLVLAGAALRLWRYFPMRSGWKIRDPGGFGRVLGGLLRDLPGALRQRRPVRWETWRRWREMTAREPEPYRPPGPAAGGRGDAA